jgi:thiol-disulfide isomerase/thioredoxin
MYQRLLIFFLLFVLSSLVRAAELNALRPGPAALEEYLERGKWLVVMLWASDCIACNREAYQYVEFHEFHNDSDARVLGISLDGGDQAAAQSFIEKHNVSFPNLITDFDIGSRWFENLTGQHFWGTPGFLIFDSTGELRAQQIGAVPVNLIEEFIASNSTAN